MKKKMNASTSESVDVNADMRDQESRETLVLEGTVWRVETVSTSDGTTYTWSEIISSGMQEKGTEFILEFIDDRTCVELITLWGRVSAISEYTYKIAGDKLVIRGGDYTDSSYENGTIVLTTSSNDKFQYKITNYPIIKPEMNYVSEEAERPRDYAPHKARGLYSRGYNFLRRVNSRLGLFFSRLRLR